MNKDIFPSSGKGDQIIKIYFPEIARAGSKWLCLFYHLHIVGPAYGQKVVFTAETVEKVQRADSPNFGIVKNQQLTGHRKSQNGRIYGFSTGSLCSWNSQELENYRYPNHSCNKLGEFGSVDHGTSYNPPVKRKVKICVSKIEMSPLTAKLKCPHGRGKDIYESEAVTEVGGDGFG